MRVRPGIRFGMMDWFWGGCRLAARTGQVGRLAARLQGVVFRCRLGTRCGAGLGGGEPCCCFLVAVCALRVLIDWIK